MISAFADPQYKPDTYYYTDAIGDHAVRFLQQHAAEHSDAPFFLYVAFTAAHWPMHALPEDIQKYSGRYDKGYESIRQARFDRAAALGLTDPSQPLSPAAATWSDVEDKRWEAAGMEVYAAMVDRMDQNIGKLIAELERQSSLQNTLILYLQDNGGCAEPMGRSGNAKHPDIERPAQPTLPQLPPSEFITAGSVPAQTRDGFPVRMGRRAFPGPADTYVAYGKGWANVSNTPFREYKHWVHEGGISTPLVAALARRRARCRFHLPYPGASDRHRCHLLRPGWNCRSCRQPNTRRNQSAPGSPRPTSRSPRAVLGARRESSRSGR
jgi:arylsulfatase